MGEEIWLGLDVGTRRIGVAKSDPLGLTAQPYSVIPRVGGDADLDRIVAIAEKEDVSGFVLGLPLRTDGSRGPEAEKVMEFADSLRSRMALPVELVDERYTTVIAQRALREQGVKGQTQRSRVDQVAAALILQMFLDRRRRHDA